MKTSIKDIIIGIFAIIGFYTVVTGFNSPQETQTEQTIITGTPESHEWEAYGTEGNWGWLVNKKTGEVYGLDAGKKARVIVGQVVAPVKD